jgi:signal transduction histidine kinase
MSDNFVFADEQLSTPFADDSWKLFIVDDDKDIHNITKLALKGLHFKGKPIAFESAYSAHEAIETLRKNPEFAIVLLDIGMEEKDSGLDVASFIRKHQADEITRIIIRTGQHGEVPERKIIDLYDINDYKAKTDLTVEKLFTSIRTAIAQYDQIHSMEVLNSDLAKRIEDALHIQKKQQEALFLQNQGSQMNEMLTMIAHQWRQPLARISAVTAQVQLALALDEIENNKLDRQINDIQTYTTDLSNTIDEFRKVYQSSDKKESIQLLKFLQQASAIISNSYHEQNIKITINCDESLYETNCSSEINQVILNLLKNSQEAFLRCENEAEININVIKNEKNISIHIQDNAGGIKDELLTKVFDPYFSTKENKNGHGLGLYMSRNIIEQRCKGKLTLQSSNNTSTFTITIPR